jgi:hypothetical protein
MSRCPEARVTPEASGNGESSRSRLKTKHTVSFYPLSTARAKTSPHSNTSNTKHYNCSECSEVFDFQYKTSYLDKIFRVSYCITLYHTVWYHISRYRAISHVSRQLFHVTRSSDQPTAPRAAQRTRAAQAATPRRCLLGVSPRDLGVTPATAQLPALSASLHAHLGVHTVPRRHA